MKFAFPLRTASALNTREHYMTRHRRVKAEREATALAIRMAYGTSAHDVRPKPPLTVTLTRVAPSNGLDPSDNLPSAFKGIVDQISAWLGVDDKSPLVSYRYEQRRGPWGVEVEIT